MSNIPWGTIVADALSVVAIVVSGASVKYARSANNLASSANNHASDANTLSREIDERGDSMPFRIKKFDDDASGHFVLVNASSDKVSDVRVLDARGEPFYGLVEAFDLDGHGKQAFYIAVNYIDVTDPRIIVRWRRRRSREPIEGVCRFPVPLDYIGGRYAPEDTDDGR